MHQRAAVQLTLLVVLVNAVVLRCLGVLWWNQLALHAELTALTFAGTALLQPWRAHFADRVSLLAASFLVGLLTAALCLFAGLHLAHAWLTKVAACSFVLLGALAVRGIGGLRQLPHTTPWCRTPIVLPLAAAFALLLSGITCYGAMNVRTAELRPHDPVCAIDWGCRWDKEAHLLQGPLAIAELGFPLPEQAVPDASGAFGLESLLVGCAALQPVPIKVGTVHTAKLLTYACYFALGLLVFNFARSLFALSVPWSLGTAAAFVLFGPIHPEPWQFRYSALVGFLWSSGGMYHNLTQLFSLAVGALGLFLIASVGVTGSTFVFGAALVAGSFFLKPALYTVAGPAIVLLLGVQRKHLRASAWFGLLCLITPILFTLVYPRLSGSGLGAPLDLACSPFSVLFHYNRSFPGWLAEQSWLRAVAIVGCSHAAFLWVTGCALRQRLLRGDWQFMPAHWLFVSMFVLGQLSSIMLVEDNQRRFHENFLWAGAAATQLALPLLFAAARNLTSSLQRRVSYALIALHLYGGMHHLALFVPGGFMHPL